MTRHLRKMPKQETNRGKSYRAPQRREGTRPEATMAATHSARSMSLASFRAGHAVRVDAERAERGGREPAALNLRTRYPIDATARPELPTARAHTEGVKLLPCVRPAWVIAWRWKSLTQGTPSVPPQAPKRCQNGSSRLSVWLTLAAGESHGRCSVCGVPTLEQRYDVAARPGRCGRPARSKGRRPEWPWTLVHHLKHLHPRPAELVPNPGWSASGGGGQQHRRVRFQLGAEAADDGKPVQIDGGDPVGAQQGHIRQGPAGVK